MTLARQLRAVFALVVLPAAVSAQGTELPLKHPPKPTVAGITAGDLMTRLYIFADDSMQGRETGTEGHLKSTAYIANELKRLGLTPAGDKGSFFQSVPLITRAFDQKSSFGVDGTTLMPFVDYVPQPGRGTPRSVTGAEVVYGGVFGDPATTISPDQMSGKLVVFAAPPGGMNGASQRAMGPRTSTAAAVAIVAGEQLPVGAIRAASPRPGNVSMPPQPGAPTSPLTLAVTRHAAEVLLGGPIDALAPGTAGKRVAGDIRFTEGPAPARNVVAIFLGSDPRLETEYVALGAHNDHIGYSAGGAVDTDSLHLYNRARFDITAGIPRGQRPSADQQAQLDAIRVNLDSVRRLRPVRLDSIRNGADDDGSGSVTLLEIAEAFAKNPTRPRRSILFVWHTGEEKGLLGSRWASDHLPVPTDSVIAQLNMDMVGRGAAGDTPGGGPNYLMLVGSRRLSTELGDIVEAVNATEKMPLNFDYQFDANGHPENIYCRSDHYNYARVGIPIVFFTTGLHGDYHQVSDEPQYIDYPHMARVGQLVYDVALHLANLDHRPVVDKPKPDPNATCRQ